MSSSHVILQRQNPTEELTASQIDRQQLWMLCTVHTVYCITKYGYAPHNDGRIHDGGTVRLYYNVKLYYYIILYYIILYYYYYNIILIIALWAG